LSLSNEDRTRLIDQLVYLITKICPNSCLFN
jgi:hypothetical protein